MAEKDIYDCPWRNVENVYNYDEEQWGDFDIICDECNCGCHGSLAFQCNWPTVEWIDGEAYTMEGYSLSDEEISEFNEICDRAKCGCHGHPEEESESEENKVEENEQKDNKEDNEEENNEEDNCVIV